MLVTSVRDYHSSILVGLVVFSIQEDRDPFSFEDVFVLIQNEGLVSEGSGLLDERERALLDNSA